MNISVLSDGAWGTALALVLYDNSHNVKLWGPFPEYIEEMHKTRENVQFLPGIKLPNGLALTADMESALENSELLLLASPSQYLRSVLEKLKSHYSGQKVVCVTKGIENNTLLRMSELTKSILGDNIPYGCLSGPTHAEEVARKLPAAIVAASTDSLFVEEIQKIFMNAYFRVYSSQDVVGVELGGALKNVFAIAAGIVDGMRLGDNAKAALMTRGIAEMARFGVLLGGRYYTFSGLSGIGDLIVTCTSKHSRNRSVGEQLGQGKKLADIIENMGMSVAEGVKTTLSVKQLADKYNVDTPIINEIYFALYEDKSPRQALSDLMSRKARPEIDNINFYE